MDCYTIKCINVSKNMEVVCLDSPVLVLRLPEDGAEALKHVGVKGKVFALQARCGPEGGKRYKSNLP